MNGYFKDGIDSIVVVVVVVVAVATRMDAAFGNGARKASQLPAIASKAMMTTKILILSLSAKKSMLIVRRVPNGVSLRNL